MNEFVPHIWLALGLDFLLGDPGLASLAKLVLRRFGLHACEVLPGISSVQVAFARLGLDWLDARILSAHARLPLAVLGELSDYAKLAILAGHRVRWRGWRTCTRNSASTECMSAKT